MTVSYYPSIATVRQGALIGLLLRWKGSLYKLVLPELVLFLIMYSIVSVIYRFALTEEQRVFFVSLCVYLDRYTNQSGLTFCLGFFVSVVMTRWWETFRTLPWLSTPSYVFRQMIVGGSETECFDVRRRLVRYLLLSWIFLTRKVSGQIMRRFKPSSKLLRDSTLQQKLTILNQDVFIARYHDSLITDEEIDTIIRFAKRVYPETYDTYQPDHFLPLAWAADVVRNARKRKLILTDLHEKHMLRTLETFRSQLAMIGLMDQFNIPLVYTQVVCWSMHVYFIFSLFAEQFHGTSSSSSHGGGSGSEASTSPPIDLYVPFPSLFQLAFYFGWIKVAEVCLNPFGDDDDDFPMWNILNMNVENSYKIVSIPELSILAEPEKSPQKNAFAASSVSASGSHAQSRRLSQTSQFEAFTDSDAAERYRDEYERLARKYERPAYRGSAIESQMDREATAVSTNNLSVAPSADGHSGSRLLLHEAGRALRKMSSVLRGAPSSSLSSRSNTIANPNEDGNLLPLSNARPDRVSWAEPLDTTNGTNCCDASHRIESPNSHLSRHFAFGAAAHYAHSYSHVHEGAAQDADHDERSASHSHESSSLDDVRIAVPTKWHAHHEDGATTTTHLEIITEEGGQGSSSSCCSGSDTREVEDAEALCEDELGTVKLRKMAVRDVPVASNSQPEAV